MVEADKYKEVIDNVEKHFKNDANADGFLSYDEMVNLFFEE